MSQLNTPKNPAPKDWHVADIKCALEKKGWSLARLSRMKGYYPRAAAMALRMPWPKMERIIAEAIGVTPQTIWPSRYDEYGNSNRRRGGYRSGANGSTGRQKAVIQTSGAR